MCVLLRLLQANRAMEKYLVEEWAQVEADLMKERGLWGPPVGSELDKFQLDMTEGRSHYSCVRALRVTSWTFLLPMASIAYGFYCLWLFYCLAACT